MESVLANIAGPDLIIVAVVVLVLFGGSQVPKLARGLGQAKNEFEKAQKDEAKNKDETPRKSPPPPPSATPPAGPPRRPPTDPGAN